MQVDFSIWDHFEHRPHVPAPRQYQEKIQLVLEAERLGFYAYHVAEHHVSPLDLAPSPNVFLAALAQATTRIRVGSAVHILPLYNPVRLVQEICMLDNISNGRLDIGIGPGARQIEHVWFGVDREEIRPRYEEMRRLLVTVLRNGNLGYEGVYYKIPEQPLDLVPVQRPLPPLWYAGGVETAGRHGMSFLTRNIDHVGRYWELWDEHHDDPDRLNSHVAEPRVGMTRHLIVRESYEEAVEIGRRAWPFFEEHWWATPIRLTEDGKAAPNQTSATVAADFDRAIEEDTRVLIGTPTMVRERLEQWVNKYNDRPSFYFAPAVQWGDITTEEALESISLLARDVMPAFQTVTAS